MLGDQTFLWKTTFKFWILKRKVFFPRLLTKRARQRKREKASLARVVILLIKETKKGSRNNSKCVKELPEPVLPPKTQTSFLTRLFPFLRPKLTQPFIKAVSQLCTTTLSQLEKKEVQFFLFFVMGLIFYIWVRFIRTCISKMLIFLLPSIKHFFFRTVSHFYGTLLRSMPARPFFRWMMTWRDNRTWDEEHFSII